MAYRIHDLPTHERPRERLGRDGPEGLSERELLALVLRNGRPGASAIEVATALLAGHDGLGGLATARLEELARMAGIGPAKAAAVVAAFELGRRSNGGPKAKGPMLRGPSDIAEVARARLAGLRRERVLVLVCDAGNRLRQVVTISDGALDHCLLPVREVLNAVLRHDGRALALAHNHPSGDPSPSQADRDCTRRLVAAADVVGLRFLDHVVVTNDEWKRVDVG